MFTTSASHDQILQSSIPEELDRESIADIRTVVISYLLMFLYIALFLGSFARKIILGIYGLFSTDRNTRVCCVCMSVSIECHYILMSYLMLCTVIVYVLCII